MPDIKQREDKIKAKRMQTPWRDFVKEICSRKPIVLSKNKGQISRFPASDRVKNIMTLEDFEDNRDDLLKYGLSTDGSDFMKRYQQLWQEAPAQILFNMSPTENADYADVVHNVKNIYLSSTVTSGAENVCYSFSVKEQSKNIYNSVMVSGQSENIYFGIGIIKSYNIFYSKYIYNCSNVWFSDNLIGCHDCFLCHDLENKSYCVGNIELDKAEYKSKKKEILKIKNKFGEYFKNLSTVGNNYGSKNCVGSFNILSENVLYGHFSYQVRKGNNVLMVSGNDNIENIYDMFVGGALGTKDVYGAQGGGAMENIYNSAEVPFSSCIYYSYYLDHCSYCLGCVGLKNKSFCILNKQYTKEERFELANKIFAQMDTDGTLGEFFPGSMNPFYFNDTAAYLIDDTFTKEEVTKAGYLRRDEAIKVDIPANADIISTKELDKYQGFDSEGKWQINPEILKKVIKDDKCDGTSPAKLENYYRIVPMELDFLQKYGLPLPELHWLDRIKLGFKFK